MAGLSKLLRIEFTVLLFGIVAGPIMFALSACGSSAPDVNPTASPDPEPTGYYIRKVDLYRNPALDICRRADRDFAMTFMGRVSVALAQAGIAGPGAPQFEDFNVVPDMRGRPGQDAVIRFRVDRNGEEKVLMSAIGKFDPRSCKIGPLTFRVGPDPLVEPEFAEQQLRND